MKNFIEYSQPLSSHSTFNNHLTTNINTLVHFKLQIDSITDYKLTNPSKALEFGRVLKLFYELYDNNAYSNAFLYSFGFNGYIDCIDGLIHNIDNKQINFNKFTSSKKNIIKQNYYGCLKNDTPVKNNIKLNKNFIITGPNASGKTTLLKSVLINIIFTQQYGCGFYESAKLKPFHHIHSYLNIPDTSGRDSLFQAEARRCKDILDIVKYNPDESHFCIFDELYSGTNPDEAVISATAFMKYLTNNPNVRCMLTTHFFKLAKNLRHLKQFTNSHMDTTKEGDLIQYNFKLKPGISTVKGCFNVLFDMKFPTEILNSHK
jgi:DNA mismatch repair ATPase MutS